MFCSVSKRFRAAVKLADLPAWKIAMRADVNPNVLSKVMTGAIRVKRGDPRVVRVGRVLGLSEEECFEAQTRKSQ